MDNFTFVTLDKIQVSLDCIMKLCLMKNTCGSAVEAHKFRSLNEIQDELEICTLNLWILSQ